MTDKKMKCIGVVCVKGDFEMVASHFNAAFKLSTFKTFQCSKKKKYFMQIFVYIYVLYIYYNIRACVCWYYIGTWYGEIFHHDTWYVFDIAITARPGTDSGVIWARAIYTFALVYFSAYHGDSRETDETAKRRVYSMDFYQLHIFPKLT